ncbi:MAG: hypothetical protein ACJ77J_08935 [Gemmatimonadaceae bacterium]
MRRSVVLSFFAAVGVGLFACTDLSGGSVSVLSIQFDSLPVPSIVLGDTLRDTTGAVFHPVARAFNFEGEEITPSPVYFLSPDSGITVDSATGITVGDSLRSTPARIVAAVGSLQAIQRIVVTLRPDLVVGVNDRDTLQYVLTDTTRDTSEVLTVRLTHGVAPSDSAVSSYIVSFAIVSQSDPRLSELINESGKASVVDTTDASGIAGRKIRLHPVYLTATVDSIVVNATARYRGGQVAGSPVRLVVVLEPGS